ncbi:MAG: hypothetical protein AAF907_03635 [Planctomycetota bacterium]
MRSTLKSFAVLCVAAGLLPAGLGVRVVTHRHVDADTRAVAANGIGHAHGHHEWSHGHDGTHSHVTIASERPVDEIASGTHRADDSPRFDLPADSTTRVTTGVHLIGFEAVPACQTALLYLSRSDAKAGHGRGLEAPPVPPPEGTAARSDMPFCRRIAPAVSGRGPPPISHKASF